MEGIKTVDEIIQEQCVPSTKIDNLVPNEALEPKTPREHFIDSHKTAIKDDDISIFPRPRPSCRHCNGSGSEGWNISRQEIVLCRCIRNRIFKEVREEKAMLTYGELKELYNAPRRLRGLPPIQEVQEEKE